MSPRRAIASLLALTLSAGVAWSVAGSFDTAAWGQEDVVLIDRAHAGAHRPDLDQPIFVLVLGSDARTGLPTNTRYDSIHIVGLDPVSKQGAIIGIPRDTFVRSAVTGSTRKITEHGYFDGSIEGFVSTVEGFSGCSFDYFMVTAFQGFAGEGWRARDKKKHVVGGIINAIGGVTVKVPKGGIYDDDAFERVPALEAGKQVLNGAQALAWSRARKSLSFAPRGDFSRSENQGKLMLAVFDEMKRDWKQDRGTALRNIAAVKRIVRSNLDLTEMLDLGLTLLRFNAKKLTNIVADGFSTTENGSSIVRLTSRGQAQVSDVCADGVLDS